MKTEAHDGGDKGNISTEIPFWFFGFLACFRQSALVLRNGCGVRVRVRFRVTVLRVSSARKELLPPSNSHSLNHEL